MDGVGPGLRVYCVTGVHRSGTSFVARVVNLLGVDIGPEDALLPPAADNPRGFWENAAIKELNDRVLATLGGTWSEPPVVDPGWENDPALDPLLEEAEAALQATFAGDGLVAFKDPRTSLLLPFWRRVVPIEGTILVVRDPAEVATSLAFRNGLPPEEGAELWLRYNAAAWLDGGENRLVVRYDDFFDDLRKATKEVADFFGLDEPDETTLKTVEEEFDPGLRRYRVRPSPIGPTLALAYSIHDLLLAPDSTRTVGPLLESLDQRWRATRDLRVVDDLRNRISGLEKELVDARKRREADLKEAEKRHAAVVAERDEARAQLQTARDEAREQILVVEAERDELRAERDELRAERDEARAEREEARAAARAERDQARAELEEAQRRIAQANREVESARTEAEQKGQTVAGLRSQAASARKAARDAERRYNALNRSRSVRLAIWGSNRVKPIKRAVVGRTRHREPTVRKPTKEPSRDRAKPAAPAEAAAPPIPVAIRQRISTSEELAALERLATRPPVTIIIPVFNAYDDVARCLASVERNTSARDADVVVVDDASTDPRIAELLEEVGRWGNVRVLRNETNQGFTRTVNRGLRETTGDVILLNSDCEVTPRWVQNLAYAAYRDAGIATVTALSDNAGAFSVPDIGVANDRPRNLTTDDVARVVTRGSARIYPSTPTGNGFCMYVKRAALDEVGLLDEERFPRGYGEEGDFCMRALEAGWRHVVDDATIVFHRRSASFGAEKDELMRAGRRQLDERYPAYTRLVREFVSSPELAAVHDTVRATYEAAAALPGRVRPRVLFVHHRGTGGTIETNADLMRGLDDDYEPYVLTCDTRAFELSRFGPDGAELLERWEFGARLRADAFTDPDYRAIAADLLTRYAIELVHIRVLLAHTFDLASVARTLDIPVVLSFHDFFLVCPTVHLLDENDRFCGGTCTEGIGECRIPSAWVQGIPHLKHEWVYVWRREVARMFDHVDAFVTTSPAARDIYIRAYPQLADADFHLIEHGRDLPAGRPARVAPGVGKVRIAVPGSLDVHKGAHYIERLIAADTAGRLEFHFLGKVPPEYQHLGVMHGQYARDEFAAKLEEIGPSFVGIFAIWAETYSHTLSEAWAAGVPVLVTDLGAPRERVERHGGGWILPHDDPEAAYERIVEICDDEGAYREVANGVGTTGIRPCADMVADYDHLYRSVLVRRRAVQPPRRCAKPVARAAVFVPGGSAGPHTGSVHVRTLRRIRHPLVRQELDTSLSDPEDLVEDLVESTDVVIVQRTAVPAELVDTFLERVHRRSVPLVVDVDDNLFAIEPDSSSYEEYERHLVSLDRLLRAADLVTVSTGLLADATRDRARRVEVVPNMLDEVLWFGGGALDVPDPAAGRRRAAFELLYFGTKTHGEDLAMLRPVLQRLRDEHGIDVALSVIGGEPDRRNGDRWYHRVPVPAGLSHYPSFVPWLRGVAAWCDAAVAPLQDTTFNHYKSDLKFLEYSALGLAGVYSALPPYSGTVEDRRSGLLAENTVDAWVAAITELARDAELRGELAANARSYVVEERCLSQQASSYLDMLRLLAG